MFCIVLFLRERGEGKEKEGEKNISVWLPFTLPLLGTWPATQACAPTGNRTSDSLVRRPALNPLSRTGQDWRGFIFILLLTSFRFEVRKITVDLVFAFIGFLQLNIMKLF